MDSIITNESQWGKYRVGDGGKSFGLVHIHLPSNPDITREQAEDDDFALNYLASEIKAGREWKWSICSCVAYLRIKGVKMPRLITARDLDTNSTIPRKHGAVKLKYSSTYHLAFVEEVTPEGIKVSEYNYKRCQSTKRVIDFTDPAIIGFYAHESG